MKTRNIDKLLIAGLMVFSLGNQSMASPELLRKNNLNKELSLSEKERKMHSLSNKNQLQTEKLIQIFKKSMMDIVENMQADEAVIAQYVSPAYVQWVDGKHMDYNGFIRHMNTQKKHITSAKIQFIEVIAVNNVVSSIHDATITKKNGSKSVIRVIGHMTYQDNKLVSVNELTFLMSGHDKDKHIGSIQ